MSRFSYVIPLFAILVVSLPASADDKSEINAVYAKLTRAFLNGDASGIAALTAPDFTYRHKNGMVEKGPQMIAQLKSEFARGMDVTKMENKILSLKISGNTATAMTLGYGEMKQKGPDGKVHVMTDKSTAKDVLVKTPNGWKFKSVQILKSQMTMDGKPFDPFAMMAPPKAKK